MDEFASTFIFFFAVIDPIGTVPVFLAVTAHYDRQLKRKIALQATAISAVILLFFIVVGELILTALGIPLSAFEVAGGVILFLFSLTMIFGDGKPEEELKLTHSSTEKAIFPLAIPSIASPGAILAAIMLTEKDRFHVTEQLQTAFIMLLVLVVVLILLLCASWIDKLIGKSGASVISRIMGIILSAVAITSILSGIKNYYGL
ncbi:MarC family protein [Neptunomonas concharum]|uniref:UPF0056 membrane protein n=1 Tax=Neptunomonas concharum TaxID=1031538 RepID=A0A5P1RC73_9GAMM|nr:MarC family protein [Neptunomonas concharum]QEQ97259.1 MarC family protein [Neptunomonas concharum]